MVSKTTELPLKMLISTEELKKTMGASEQSSDQSSTAYIILQNNKLHAQFLVQKEESCDLQKQLEDMEIEVDSLTRSRNCLQGYVKNEVELAQNYKSLLKSTNKITKQLFNHLYISFAFHLIIMIIIMLISSHQKAVMGVVLAYIMMNSVFQMKQAQRFIGETKSPENKKYSDGIKKIEQSNTYIQELIDNI